jgi:glycine C-acetyltransferase/8-amino-7-oxononanoate synthase
MESPVGPRARIDGREVDYFCGTSYFGLHAHPLVVAAACAATRAYGIGPATGISTPPLEDLMDQASRFFGTETITCVTSGYLGPAVLVQALRDEYDLAFADSAAHYSILDALRGTGKPFFLFRHLDPGDLAGQLQLHVRPGARPLMMTDGVFPSTGAVAPLSAYAEVLGRYESSLLCVDDAHGVGVIGDHGRGSFEHHSLQGQGLRFCATLSKAFGGSGGIIPGDALLEASIRQRSSVPLGASAPPAPALAAAAAGIRLLAGHPEMRSALWANARRARDGLRGLGFDLADTVIPIVSLTGSASIDLYRVWASLDQEDMVVLHVPPRGYSDAPDVESLRIALCSGHTEEQIDRLIDGIRRAL